MTVDRLTAGAMDVRPGGAVGLEAVRVELFAPVASFRDPMFPGLTRCLPVPPPSSLRGLLAAATGAAREPVTFGYSAHAAGAGVDAETYHPIATDGTNPASGGRVRAVKRGTALKDRPFLAHLSVTLWIPEPDGQRIAAALRRPVWALRMGRSQDLVFVRSVTSVLLQSTDEAVVGHALAPRGGHAAPTAVTIRLAELIHSDRLTTHYGDYLWSAAPVARLPVRHALRDGDQAVWLRPTPAADGR
ncbi:CRISPR-associated protein Cas5 [Salinispora tropica]|uniref:CRISPR-associated protein, Cas5t family n=1 Tax=Salinispora tropica (strain ATCC BAA-916 / DSM 44818 / JCM 13857 / NBRC 105044 / CNB-440) TaxID=369723 RepID=A4X3M7_SALTO|nr:CRISPR-associated protein Cas5 [Salinispora tropica]ABP53477.1 CRISPR-associated protein, Cas5t family [Salinispora tropica CNB-440]